MRKTRLGAAAILASAMFLPLATCTQNGQTTKYVPYRDGGDWWMVLLVYALPLALVLLDTVAHSPWVKLAALSIEPLAIAFSGYALYFVVALRTPTIWFYVAAAAVMLFFVSAVVGLVQQIRAMRRRSRELRAVLTQ